ncbi:MAG: molybdopterin-binding protein, partial [Coriobacteriia bacterium]|nr:molybdopterin-binding protein [Coriobacteriia bacterium]
AGLALIDACEQRGWVIVAYHVVPDDPEAITASLIELADVEGADAVFTLGGTGLGVSDLTPEATELVCERIVPGIPEAIRAHMRQTDPCHMFSRATAGVRGRTLIVNLPGGPEATMGAFGVIAEMLELAVEHMADGGAC